MKINWKLRFQNRATLMAMAVQVVALVYTVLGMRGIVPGVTQDQTLNLVTMVVELLALLGIVVDPTTKGVSDSIRAMGYEEPK